MFFTFTTMKWFRTVIPALVRAWTLIMAAMHGRRSLAMEFRSAWTWATSHHRATGWQWALTET